MATPHGAVELTHGSDLRVDSSISPLIYINRCVGGCTIHGGQTNDASSNESTLPCAAGADCTATPGSCTCADTTSHDYTVQEFQNSAGQTGAAADDEWNQLMTCVREVYSPYAVTVTDTQPAVGTPFTEGIAAGFPEDIGWSREQVGGIAVVYAEGSCVPKNNIISFSFANIYSGPSKILELCQTVAQETAHSFGLDHEYQFTSDSSSACRSPMSYRDDCGGQRFFRNQTAACGEYAVRTCCSGGVQDSHQKLLSVFGPGTSLIPAPTTSIVSPAANDSIQQGATIQSIAGSRRGVATVELWINNNKWADTVGAPFGNAGQDLMASYALQIPSAVPNGVMDLEVKAYDDLGVEGDSSTVTVTMGAPCTDTSTCLKGQKCDAGKCYWDAPVGVLGNTCDYDEYCTSGICANAVCSQSCIIGSTGACPMGFSCEANDSTASTGYCLPPASGGCCSASRGTPWGPVGFTVIVLGLVLRRRR